MTGPLRIGLLGASGIAPRAMIDPVRRRSDVVLAAIASSRPDAAERYAATHGIDHAYGSYERLLDDPAIDIVYVGLPIAAHAQWTIAALEAGKHVICEKPFALDAAEARAMVAAAERAGRRLMEAFHYRYHPLFAHVLDLCQSGRLGAIERLEARLHVAIPFDASAIRHAPHLGGGALMDLGCYPVHQVRSIIGAEPIVRSASITRTPLGVDDTTTAELTFENGCGAQISAVMTAGTPTSSLLRVIGTTGTLDITNPSGPHDGHSISLRLSGTAPEVYTIAGKTTFDYQLAAFLDAIRSGTPLPTEGSDPIGNMATIDAIYAAAGGRISRD